MRNYCRRFAMPALTLALAACSWQGGTSPQRLGGAVASVAHPAPPNRPYKIIYDFPGGAGGKGPGGGLTFVNGVMFGTTGAGGRRHCDCGTVFAGTNVIYSFKGMNAGDGSIPTGGLLPVGDKLYGETSYGGGSGVGCSDSSDKSAGCGTVYQIDAGGNERIVYRFKGGSDGITPIGGLTYLNGTIYGVTNYGGGSANCPENSYSAFPPGCGVVFAIDSSGREKVIHRFTAGTDGAYPIARLLALDGVLYGTTFLGGTCSGSGGRGCGTVFRITPSGKESVIHSFQGGDDGQGPFSSLVSLNGFLWGTTQVGGLKFGTIFKMSTSGYGTTVYRFNDVPDGAYPAGLLAVVGNSIYGTTQYGGTRSSGTMFSVDSEGVQLRHNFRARNEAGGGLTYDDATKKLYGEAGGGRYQAGTIFRYKP